jgi:pSer/pThr/pTyr-binding forkhead associated (FHA) protein
MFSEYVGLAEQTSREEFAARFPLGFLIGKAPPAPPRHQHVTMGFANTAVYGKTRAAVAAVARATGAPLALEVRKVQPQFPAMITVGRTPNNDIAVDDLTVSKFHAYFRVSDEGVDLTDAGSKNGTWLNGLPLAAKTPAPVRSGDVIRFAQSAFKFLSPGDSWEHFRSQPR